MTVTCRVFACAAVLLVTVPAVASAQVCSGKNIVDEMKATSPEQFATLRKTADAMPNAGKLLWKVEDKENPQRGASYIYGTVHLTDERLHKFSPAVMNAFSSVRTVGVEVANKPTERLAEGMLTLHQVGRLQLEGKETLDQLLTPAERQAAAVGLRRAGLPADIAARVQPWVAMVMLSAADCEFKRLMAGRQPLDGEIARLAEDRGVGTFDIETVETQFDALAAVPTPQQLALLKGTVALAPRLADVGETMVQLHLSRDTGMLWPLHRALAKSVGVDEEALNAYHEQVVVERTKRMANRLASHLQRGGVFIAVGAMHLPGEDGLIEEVKRMGLSITPVE